MPEFCIPPTSLSAGDFSHGLQCVGQTEVVSVPGPSRGAVSLLIFLLACSCLFAVCPDSAKTLLSLDLIQCYLNCKSIDYKIN